VSTVFEICHQLGTDHRLPPRRLKDIMTALKYLAAAYDRTPEQLALTPEIEAEYKAKLRDFMTLQHKHPRTIRNTVQSVGQFLRAVHELPAKTPIPQVGRRPTWKSARDAMAASSPYRHQGWLSHSTYVLPQAQWPTDVTRAFKKFAHETRHRLRPASLQNYVIGVSSLLGYLNLTADERLDRLPKEARDKLGLKRYADDLRLIRDTPQSTAFDDLFREQSLESFVVWHAWRIHTPTDAKVRERPPSMPSTMGLRVVETMKGLATTLKRSDDLAVVHAYRKTMRPPKPIHDKTAAYHQFSFAEINDIGKALMHEAHTMDISVAWNGKDVVQYPGSLAAERFLVGLVLMLGWRVPLRARNWCEALLKTNLRQVNGGYRWHFEGDELKIATRGGLPNTLDIKIDDDMVPYLEEYLHVWRPKLPHADDDQHVLLGLRGEGGMLTPKTLCAKVKVHVFRLGGKRLFPHLLRTIFMSNNLSAGVDINSIAYAMNDKPATVWKYNALQGGLHEHSLQDAWRRAVASGHQLGSREER
jgi:hypothetical protein